jgi:hypothetical protein
MNVLAVAAGGSGGGVGAHQPVMRARIAGSVEWRGQ